MNMRKAKREYVRNDNPFYKNGYRILVVDKNEDWEESPFSQLNDFTVGMAQLMSSWRETLYTNISEREFFSLYISVLKYLNNEKTALISEISLPTSSDKKTVLVYEHR